MRLTGHQHTHQVFAYCVLASRAFTAVKGEYYMSDSRSS